MGLENKTIVLLIDFEGHTLLSADTALNDLRFSKLKQLLFETPRFDDLCIVSEHLYKRGQNSTLNDLKHEVMDRYCWVELPDPKDLKFDKTNPFNSIKWIC